MNRYSFHVPYELLIARAAIDPAFCRVLLREPVAAAVSQGWSLIDALAFAGVCPWAATLGQFARETYPLMYGHESYRYAMRAG